MKKKVLLSAIIILLFLSFAQAVEEDVISSQNEKSDQITEKVNEINTQEIKSKTKETLSKEVKIPDQFKIFARLLGVNEDISFSHLVVYSMFLLFVFLIIYQIVKIMPFFKQGAIQFIAALAISILAASTGAIKAVVNFYYDVSIAKFIDSTSPGAFFLAVLVSIIVFFFISKIISKIGTNLEIGEVQSSASEAGLGFSLMRIFANAFSRKDQNAT